LVTVLRIREVLSTGQGARPQSKLIDNWEHRLACGCERNQ
jgi:hypothetical protein